MQGGHLRLFRRRLTSVLAVASIAGLASAFLLRRKALAEQPLPSAFFSAQITHHVQRDYDKQPQSRSSLLATYWGRLQQDALRSCSALLRGLDWLGTALPSLESYSHTVQKILGYVAIQSGVTAPFRLRSSFPVPELRQQIEERWQTWEEQNTHRDHDGGRTPSIDLFIIGDTPDVVLQLAAAATRAYPVAIAWARTGSLPPPTSSRATSRSSSRSAATDSPQMPIPALRLHISIRDLMAPFGFHDCVQVLLRAGRILHREQDWMNTSQSVDKRGFCSDAPASAAARSILEPEPVLDRALGRVPLEESLMTRGGSVWHAKAALALPHHADNEWSGKNHVSPALLGALHLPSSNDAGCRHLTTDEAPSCERLGTIDLREAGMEYVTSSGASPITSPLDDAIRLHEEDMILFDRLIDNLCDLVELVNYSTIEQKNRCSETNGSTEMNSVSTSAPIVLVFHTRPPEYALQATLPRSWETRQEPFIIGREVGSFEDLDPEEWAEFSQRMSTMPWWSEPGTDLAMYWRLVCRELLERIAHAYPQARMEACDGRLAEPIPPTTLFIGRTPGAIGLALVRQLAAST
ncbi:hypothetical protein F1559_000052 [Cyanidiococcus yangmingshanensis]|uniref:Uncharacterized protein n=1 Tax=Cyanidiococcus yangmingshanensis TaxID=2690220 RepID=A0A7J7IEM4_9RHOD|nr:hypothetical protein F1559_000052 [Cyanidiococcus yangmingshanensis]